MTTADHIDSQSAYLTSRLPNSQKVKLFEKELNMMTNIEVAAVAWGGNPSPIIIGFQIKPPPSPRDEQSPPPREPKTSERSELPYSETSDLQIPMFVRIFSFSSDWHLETWITKQTAQTTKNDRKRSQVGAPQEEIPIIEGLDFDPLNRLTIKAIATSKIHIKMILHWAILLFCRSKITLTDRMSSLSFSCWTSLSIKSSFKALKSAI